MVKNAKVEVGKTPSAVSGKKSTKIVKGEPLAKGENTGPTLEKLARAVGRMG